MTRWSILAAVAAILLSLLLHGLGLSFTVSEDRASSTEGAASDLSDVGGKFEDLAEITPEAAEPEPAAVPDPPSVTPPEETTVETPTSQALVASETPRNVIAPDIGTAEPVEPDAAEPSGSDAPAPDITQRSGGEDEIAADVADVATSQPVAPETGAEMVQAAPDETPVPAEAQTSEVASVPATETVSPVVPVAPAPAPSPEPASAPEPDMQASRLPEITVTSAPDAPEILSAEENEDLSGAAVTTSLRPPKERPTVAALGMSDGGQQPSTQQGRASGVIESPLTTYKRTGIDPFASRSGGARSGTSSLRGAFNPGNSDTTNYAGQILMQLNRAPTVYPSALGTAEVSFEISPDGTVAWINILSSTGTADIRRAATAQIRRAAPFPRPPEGTSQRLVFLYRNR